MKKTLKIMVLSMVVCATATAMAATPWGPKQQRRHHQVHKLNHKIARQERKAQRAFWHGNFDGAFKHAATAQQMANHQQHLRHKIHRSNRRWEHNHFHCHHGLYC